MLGFASPPAAAAGGLVTPAPVLVLASVGFSTLLSRLLTTLPRLTSGPGRRRAVLGPAVGLAALVASSAAFLWGLVSPPSGPALTLVTLILAVAGHRMASGGVRSRPGGRSTRIAAAACVACALGTAAWSSWCGLRAGRPSWDAVDLALGLAALALAAAESTHAIRASLGVGSPMESLFLSSSSLLPVYSLSLLIPCGSASPSPTCPDPAGLVAPLTFFIASGIGLVAAPAEPAAPPAEVGFIPDSGILLEVDPTPAGVMSAVAYIRRASRLVGGPLVLISRRTSPLLRFLSDEPGVDLLIEVSPGVSYSRSGGGISSPPDAPSISKAVRDAEERLGGDRGLLVVDSMTDLIFLSGVEEAYKIARGVSEVISDSGWRGIFLLTRGAHPPQVPNLLRGLLWPSWEIRGPEG